MDEDRLRAERANRGSWKSRVTGLEDVPGGTTGYPDGPPRRQPRQRAGGNDDDDLEYRLAIEASKNQAEEEAARRSGGPAPDNDDDLAKAIKLSREEEELRKRELEDQQQGDLLFDNTPTTEQAPQPTGFNQGYQQQAAVDWFGNPLGQQQQQQQPQQTGFMNNMYSQPTGFQNQNGYGGGFGYNQPQQTGFEQMQQPQQQFMQPQNTYNPWAQQMNGFGQQQQQPQQSMQPMQEQSTAQPGSNNPWAGSNSSTPVQAQPTGSNNPFASHRPQQQTQSFSKAPTLSTLAEQRATDSFSQQQQQRPNPIANYFSPASTIPMQQQPTQQQKPQDPYQAKLSALLASGEGQDTFGNVGDLRIPAQHTAPGTFVNSAGGGSMGALESSRTGNNPFFTQNTAAQMQYPAQTGPVGSMGGGFGGNNPFGPRPGQQQQQSQGQGGSLIDL